MPPKKSRAPRNKKEATLSENKSISPPGRNESVEPKIQKAVSPIPTPDRKRAESVSPTPEYKPEGSNGRSLSLVYLGLLFFSVLTAISFLMKMEGPTNMQPVAKEACPCVAEAYAGFLRQGNRTYAKLAATFLGFYAPLTGVHMQSDSIPSVLEQFDFLRSCGVVLQLTKNITDVDELKDVLRRPFLRSGCVVWISEVIQLNHVLNPLKELFEDNTLRGVPIVPPGKKGFLVLVTPKSREELKEELPHRVVHMLTSIAP